MPQSGAAESRSNGVELMMLAVRHRRHRADYVRGYWQTHLHRELAFLVCASSGY